MALTLRRDAEPTGPLADDYLVEGDAAAEPTRTAGAQIAQALQVLLILVMAALSLGIFWLLALLLNIL
jgi:hypothetical protein